MESERQDALISAAKHYGVDLMFARRIRDLAIQLFRRLQPVHQLPQQYADWLEAAAMLHEVGSYINRSGRRRHTYYVIAHSEIFGYTPVQRLHHRCHRALCRKIAAQSQRPQHSHSSLQCAKAACPKLWRCCGWRVRSIRAAAAPFRICGSKSGRTSESLCGSRPSTPEGVELELWAVEQEKDYFREVFGRELFAETV